MRIKLQNGDIVRVARETEESYLFHRGELLCREFKNRVTIVPEDTVDPRLQRNREYYEENKGAIGEQKRTYRKNIRQIVISLLGGKCASCGYSNCAAALGVRGAERGTQSYVAYWNGLYNKIKNGNTDVQMSLLCLNCETENKEKINEEPS